MSDDSPIDVKLTFKYQASQKQLFRYVSRNGGMYLELKAPQCLEIGGQRSGKLIDVDELIPTYEGWKRNGDIVAGDVVFDEFGHPCTVLIAHPPQYPEITYCLEFDNGTTLYAGNDHLWRTSTRKERKNGKRRTEEWRATRRIKRNVSGKSYNMGSGIRDLPVHSVRTTQEIYETQRCGEQVLRGKKVDIANHQIECARPLGLPHAELSISPYLLGLWLGDGSTASGIIWGVDEDVAEYAKRLPDEEFKESKEPFCHRVSGLTKRLSALGVIDRKHIPAQYLRASIAQRISLLAGLMDSDGSGDVRGGCEWSNTDRTLVDGMSELLSSLGIKHQFRWAQKHCWYKGEKRVCYTWRTSFTTSVPCFNLPRKRMRQKVEGLDGQSLSHRIVSVREAPRRLMRCLTVDSPSHLYLCNRAMIPTHNTTGKLVYGIENYCLKFKHCDMLVLRRTISELKSGAIEDFFKFFPKDSGWYTYNHTDRIATFANGSRLVFGGCENLLEKDIEKYLGQAYPFILIDECGQFSDHAWNLLYARNLVNVQCEPDELGNYPTPYIVGCTNPTGPYWTYYHTVFVKQEPWERSEGMKRSKDGRWFVERAGNLVCAYDPTNYAYNHSTVMDNPEYIKRQPDIVRKLQALPEALMKKYLLGYMDTVEGPYFDCFSDEYHVVDLREDPEAIQWQDWQPVWVGHDWGVGHWSAAYFFTKAMVKVKMPDGSDDFKLKTVCFQEVAPESTGYTNVEFADMLSAKAFYPRLPESHSQYNRISGKRCKVSAIYFSHEKFSRSMEKHSPSDEYSRLMRERGLPPVSRATTDRIGRASFMYNELKLGRLVVLKSCPGIILAIPSLQRDKDNLDDVLKVDNKADDRYDGFCYGLYGGLSSKLKPQEEKDREYADTLDPMSRHFYLLKASHNTRNATKSFKQEDASPWEYMN